MTAVELVHISKSFGGFQAVREVSLPIADRAFVSLLGPSGCGKTTILRMIAGLETPSGGDIFIRGERVTQVPVHKRNIGFVFQNYALFPHKTIFDNVAYGLRYRSFSREQICEKVHKACELVKLPNFGHRRPSELSGGQQQRVALARAIVIEPSVLLLDEPLSALDASLRSQMRTEIRRLQRDLGITAIFVTHDQEEALSMSDSIVVLDQGVVQQVGTPKQVYRAPQTRFVAEFLGQANIVPGRYMGAEGGFGAVTIADGLTLRVSSIPDRIVSGKVDVVIRAHRIAVSQTEIASGPEVINRIKGIVREVSFLGNDASYFIEAGALRIHAINAVQDQPIEEGQAVWLSLRPADCILLDEAGRRIGQDAAFEDRPNDNKERQCISSPAY
jgi:ABC-type Fe3+/spermidine/putrescine transport system ATPase subunit